MNHKTDAELVVLSRNGDKAAFSHLIKRHQTLALCLAQKMMSRRDIAQELMQEAFLQAYLSLDRLRDDDKFQSWLCGITINVCRSHIRHQKMNFLSFEEIMGGMKINGDVFGSVFPSPMKVAQEQELYNLVLEAVNSLSPKNRTTVLLFYFEQLTIDEISALLNISVTAIKGRLYKARKQLKAKLLPLYLEYNPVVSTDRNTKSMIEVTIADVFVPTISNTPQSSIVILWDKANHRFLNIFVGIPSGETIAHILTKTPMTRPMTLQFMSNMLKAANAYLESVRIESLREDIYYATVSLGCNGQVREVDARPSDAIALALLMNSPIYVNEAVMKEASIKAPPEVENAPVGRGLSNFKNEYEKKEQSKKEKYRQLNEPEKKAVSDKTINFLFNRD